MTSNSKIHVSIRRILNITILCTLAGFGICLAAVSLYYKQDRVLSWWQDRPKFVTEYAEVKLGSTMDDVSYIKGGPNYVEHYSNKFTEEVANKRYNIFDLMKIGKRSEDFLEWTYIVGDSDSDYKNNKVSTLLVFDESTKALISISCTAYEHEYTYDPGQGRFCPRLFGLYFNASENNVIDALGKPDRELVKNGAKFMYYDKYNVRFGLARRVVFSITVGDN